MIGCEAFLSDQIYLLSRLIRNAETLVKSYPA